MLVLSRKIGERIHIGNDVFVEVRRVAGNRVTLAIKAPREVRILRGELMDVADEFHVLDEPVAEESAKDTVIINADIGNAECGLQIAEVKTETAAI
ncbi:MAG: carbon storage regulator [Planctomycetes bacterium]|nr:carbon storage regulator [Planctomycetota bacterium]